MQVKSVVYECFAAIFGNMALCYNAYFFWAVATHMSHDENACTYTSIKSNAIAFIVYCIKYKDHRILKWLKKDALDDKIVHFPSYLIY